MDAVVLTTFAAILLLPSHDMYAIHYFLLRVVFVSLSISTTSHTCMLAIYESHSVLFTLLVLLIDEWLDGRLG